MGNVVYIVILDDFKAEKVNGISDTNNFFSSYILSIFIHFCIQIRSYKKIGRLVALLC